MNQHSILRSWKFLSVASATLAIAGVVVGGCAYDVDRTPLGDGIAGSGSSETCSGMGGMGGASSGQDAPPTRVAERAIAEADIVRIDNGRLYALSQNSGLSVIDVSMRDQLLLLDQHEIDGVPLEMIVRAGVAYVMVDLGAANHRSQVLALDVSNPSSIAAIGVVPLPGHLSDTRLVGDVLYAVTYEVHQCETCPELPTTTITSLLLTAAQAPEQVDQLEFTQSYVDDIGWKRSVTVTSERMYVAGVEWDGSSNDGHSTIQIVDITDPAGTLIKGAAVEASGQILSRWQMDEHEGVLRVVSQPGVWSVGAVPVVQTFTVGSSYQLEPLGSLALELSVPESLRSVRFDGDRVYAITAQPTEPYDPTPGSESAPPPAPVDMCGMGCDPLFVVDLSDPAQPVQVGELEMPGWVFHMEPRGDRLIALGFEGTYPLGPLNVTLFDVEDMSDPRMLERVSFGGEWTGLSEDQNRIHKSFSIDDDLGLILVPYGWWEWQSVMNCSDSPCGGCWDDGDWQQRGAVQLIDLNPSTLVLRGAAQMNSWARRARIHDTRLLTMSNDEVVSFDIDDLYSPAQTAQLGL